MTALRVEGLTKRYPTFTLDRAVSYTHLTLPTKA